MKPLQIINVMSPRDNLYLMTPSVLYTWFKYEGSMGEVRWFAFREAKFLSPMHVS